MSKKKKSVEEDSELEEEIKEDELEEIIEKISEKEIPEETNLDENQFREFLQTESAAPVLEEIAGEQELNTRFFSTSGIGRDFEEDENTTNYSLEKYEKPGESKYDEAPKSFQEEVSTAPNVGLARNSETRKQDFTFNTPEAQRMQREVIHDSESDYIQPKRFEQKNQAMPFEKEDRKYKEFKP